MKKLLCWLGYHYWVYNSLDIEVGTERECEWCGQKEVYTREIFTGKYIWYRIR